MLKRSFWESKTKTFDCKGKTSPMYTKGVTLAVTITSLLIKENN